MRPLRCAGRWRDVFAGVLALIPSGNASAQEVFTVTSGPTITTSAGSGPETGDVAGEIDINKDGTADGRWSFSLNASRATTTTNLLNMTAFNAFEGDFVGIFTSVDARYNGNRATSRPWDMDAKFTINASVPGVTFQPTLRGSLTYPATAGGGFQNNFSTYGFNWSNGSGGTTATIVDPLSQLNLPGGTTNGFSFTQNGASGTPLTYTNSGNGRTQSCNRNGFWANACIAWQIATPAGFSTLDVTGAGGQRIEGFGFGILSQTDIAVDMSADQPRVSVGETGSFTISITNNGVAGDSAAADLSWSDVLPNGLELTGASFTFTRNNRSFVTTSDADFAILLDVDTATNTVSFNGVTLQVGDVIEIVADFTPDGSVAGDVTNTSEITGMVQTDTDTDNDTASATVTVFSPSPAFPPGPGLSASVCNVNPATNPYQDIGLRWEFNDGDGTSPNPRIDRGDIFASATVGTYVGINAQINNFDLNINADDIPASYDPNKYIQYQFTTANFTNQAELTGFGATVFGKKGAPNDDQATGAYRFAIAIDDDGVFGSPEILMSDIGFDGVDTSTAAATTGPQTQDTYLQAFAHWDANGTTVSLAPSTTYTMRVYPYNVTEFGDDNGQPFTNIVLWDDFMPKAVNCAAAVQDDYSDTPADGGTAPDGVSTLAYGEPTHTVVAGVQLGETVTADTSAVEGADDIGSGDGSDDGLTLPTLSLGRTTTIDVAVNEVNTGDGYLQAWIDFDGDGDFTGAQEQIALNLQDNDGNGSIEIPVTVPSNTTANLTYGRFRWSTMQNLDSTTASMDGEVEDYAVRAALHSNGQSCPANTANLLTNPNFDDGFTGWTRTGTALTLRSYTGANSGFDYTNVASQDANNIEGTLVQTVARGLSGGQIFFDFGWNYAPRSKASVFTFSVAGTDVFSLDTTDINDSTALANFEFLNGASGTVAGVAYGANGSGTLANSKFREWDLTAMAIDLPPSIPDGGSLQVSYDLGRDDIAIDNFGLCGIRYDYSDAPTTGTTYGDAVHRVVAGIQLGVAIDGDQVSLASANADGDGADDDGVSQAELDALNIGETGTINVNVSGRGFLNAWIDFDGDGAFSSPVEQIATDLIDSDADGTITLAIDVPSLATTTQTFARFRWSTDFNIESDGFAKDGEVEDYQVTFNNTAPMLSGRLFLDNGVGGGVAHDGLIGGTELGAAIGTVALFDGTGNPLASAIVNADGTWNAVLPDGYAGTVQVVATANPGYRIISEDRSSVPGANNISDTDGTYSFNATAGTSYNSLNTGLISTPTLAQNQQASVSPGQVIDLPHIYTASTSGDVSFALVDQISTPANGFTSTIFADADCDGAADTVMPASTAVTADQQICLVVRTQAGSGISPSATLAYGLEASTAFTGTAITDVARNDDALGSSGTGSDLVLRKLVSNETKTPGIESVSNTGDIGDVLQYRIVMTNPGPGVANDVTVTDVTPAFTALTSPIPSPVAVGSGMSCSLITPSANVAGYMGPLEWFCPGSLPSGAGGSVTFLVTITP